MTRLMTLLTIAAALCAAAPAARAGWLYSNTVTVAAGSTNAAADLTLKANTPAETSTAELDFVTVLNASGSGTGNVAWAAVVLGAETQVESASGVAPGTRSTLWPRRKYTLNAPTNDAACAETYLTRTLRFRVWQTSTNATPTVYVIGAGTR